MENIKLHQVKKFMDEINMNGVIVLSFDEEGRQYVATYGKDPKDATAAADLGNGIKKLLKWPEDLCNLKPQERICGNCTFHHIYQQKYDKCSVKPKQVDRDKNDTACKHFIPKN